jgi:hypothetical protein
MLAVFIVQMQLKAKQALVLLTMLIINLCLSLCPSRLALGSSLVSDQ